MPAAAIIVPLAVSAASTAATSLAIGTTLAATLGSIGGAIVTGAIGGAIGGAITGGIEGGDIGMDVLTGAVGGAVSGGVGGEANTGYSGISPEVANITGLSPNAAQSVTKGLTGFSSGTAAGLAGGQKLGQALKSGAVSGIASGVASGVGNQIFGGDQIATQTNPSSAQLERAQNRFGALPFFQENPNQPPPFNFQSFSFDPNLPSPDQPNQSSFGGNQLLNQGAQGALSRGISTGLNDLLSTGQPSGGAISAGPSERQPQGSLNLPPAPTGINTTNPSVSALAQALRTVPDLGYSPGGPVFGSQSTAKPKKVWNRASLRVMDEETP